MQNLNVGEYVQDTIGHWYLVLEVQARGWRYKVDQLYVARDSGRRHEVPLIRVYADRDGAGGV